MEPSTNPDRLERLVRDYRRMNVIYGLSIVSLALVITAIVWATPSFDLFSALLPGTATPDTFIATPAHVSATTTPVRP